ncbi:hypothetical protein COT75_00670 [Candidatus Beckwithbacteria bacterium CG10_big_fil_rev_8_21_14_0_10_34_10]|uniref:PABS domain-containing protein n=1 Tax=Candidatus Beckwithbacteria bacterium CG10_big_fil_rev_8_21_14_0_10_34_10 TaxID=1974495 RepID=A0A2H0WAV0_9BACT|nr:MAG: hypothetical protein COT75_00670 [Candidatus Beckwithbacteria bacterium CG10_big_fil_rev_8_21_14_0_10_34_10]
MKITLKLALISFLILFLELLFIRLIGTEIRIFAYLSNLVLLAIFLGSGLGMFIKKKLSLMVSSSLILILSLIVISGLFKGITNLISPLSESFIWFQTFWSSSLKVFFGLGLTIILFFLLVLTFVPLGQHLGNIFKESKKIIWFYTINILFSLLGMWLFYLLSFLRISPFIGIIISQLILSCLVTEKERNLSFLIFIFNFVLIVIFLTNLKNTIWSPYQKLAFFEYPPNIYQMTGYQIQVNNVGYMGLLDLSKEHRNNLEKTLDKQSALENFNLRFSNQYDWPFLLKPEAKDVCIIGAGGGNDIAGALRAGVLKIEAVEIDPEIVKLGKKYHPENPYASSKVKVIIDDGRSFFKKTTRKYDLVIMGLADSHTLNSSLSNLQLDNFLYTKESMMEIKKILKPEGLLFISFDVQRPWIGSKIQNNLASVFGHQPLIFSLQNELPFYGWGGVVFAQSQKINQLENVLSQDKDLANFINSRRLKYEPFEKELTDDWPYLYLDKARVPKIHLIISLILLTIFVSLIKLLSKKGSFSRPSFFLGAGFLLYEFQNISKSALLFGNTWIINLLTVSAILIFILLANLMSLKYRVPEKISYIFLFISFFLQIVLPLSSLNLLPLGFKLIVAPIIMNLPLFFASLIFINFFVKAKDKKTFFASNLIGSAVGGILSFLSYAWGIKILLGISLLLYILSFLRHSSLKVK